MSFQHHDLVNGRWREFSILEQMANVGSEVERTLNWRVKNKPDMSLKAFWRSLELIDLTIQDPKNRGRLSELCRMRECWCDFVFGENEYRSQDVLWRKYFLQFTYAAQKERHGLHENR